MINFLGNYKFHLQTLIQFSNNKNNSLMRIANQSNYPI